MASAFLCLRHDERTQAGDHAISEAEIGRPFPGPIEDQQLVLDEYGFGDHGTHAAGTRQSGDRRQQVKNKDGQIAHVTILPRSRHPYETLTNLAIRHTHGAVRTALASL